MAICIDLVDFIETHIILLAGIFSFLTTLIIILSYMVGNAINNPKLLLWAKTESIQLIISLASISILILLINGFCSISPSAIHTLTDLPPLSIHGDNVFDGANQYLKQSAIYTHNVLKIQRYHLMAYEFLNMRSVWLCGDFLECWGSSVGLSGRSYAWASYFSSGFNIAFNSTLISYLSSLNFLFILQYINSGMVLFLLPFGIIFRAFPFLRKLGSLFIAISFAFMIVYPLILSSFVLISNDLFDYIDSSPPGQNVFDYTDETKLTTFGFGDAFDSAFDADFFGESDDYIDNYIFTSGRKEEIALQLVGRALIVGIFIPSLALLASIASVNVIARQLGEEVNLSRIMQMV